jgi:hypothetical protein
MNAFGGGLKTVSGPVAYEVLLQDILNFFLQAFTFKRLFDSLRNGAAELLCQHFFRKINMFQ